MMKNSSNIQDGQRTCNEYRNTITNLPGSFRNGAVASSSSEYDKLKGWLEQF
jgi:hypothetical protein